jgi:hypothetical protein
MANHKSLLHQQPSSTAPLPSSPFPPPTEDNCDGGITAAIADDDFGFNDKSMIIPEAEMSIEYDHPIDDNDTGDHKRCMAVMQELASHGIKPTLA